MLCRTAVVPACIAVLAAIVPCCPGALLLCMLLCCAMLCGPQKFEELMSKYDKDNKGGLTYREVREMCAEQAVLFDPFGRIATFLGE